jgi:hypothetical protein
MFLERQLAKLAMVDQLFVNQNLRDKMTEK